MWAASAYIFWPILWLALLLSPRKEVPFVRFHAAQGAIFGAASSLFLIVVTVAIMVLFRNSGTQSLALGMVFVGVFGAWLFLAGFLFLLFLYYAWRAGRGDMVRVPIVGSMVEQWVLGSLDQAEG